MNELVQAKDEELAENNNYDGVSAADLAPGLSNNADDSEEGSSSSTSNDDGENKLTRAQRKRLRRKKLKTDASRRRKIIGPLSPPADDDDNGSEGKNLALENGSPTVRRNAAEESPPRTDQPGEPPTCAKNRSRVKQRRLAKKLARKNLPAPSEENFDQDQSAKSCKGSNGKECAKQFELPKLRMKEFPLVLESTNTSPVMSKLRNHDIKYTGQKLNFFNFQRLLLPKVGGSLPVKSFFKPLRFNQTVEMLLVYHTYHTPYLILPFPPKVFSVTGDLPAAGDGRRRPTPDADDPTPVAPHPAPAPGNPPPQPSPAGTLVPAPPVPPHTRSPSPDLPPPTPPSRRLSASPPTGTPPPPVRARRRESEGWGGPVGGGGAVGREEREGGRGSPSGGALGGGWGRSGEGDLG
ncbi:hypothetical protein TIFTF001_004616 [Ficus carica]|uniref:Uncharacterized protein n=1 Tax=Ficus carica TaxID=3494 RepID=A0AA87ZLF1_FICCA|nr:hypothetical protein TIFTF001_004616 [Ficus carica]